MQIGVVGINHKQAELQLREQLAKTCQRRFGPGQSAHTHHAFVLLTTCNRTEIYFSSPDLAETHTYILNILKNSLNLEFDQKLYSFFNEDCFTHLCRVTCGLDSAILFESEVQGQVKIAYEKACYFSNLPCDLHFLFQKTLRVGKKMRSTMPFGYNICGLEQAIFNTGRHFFKDIHNKRILFIGASDINLKTLHFLKNKGAENITLCNRTDKIASDFSEKYQTQALPWKQLSDWHTYDWIIFGTKSPEHLISIQDLPQEIVKQKLLIDLCVPRNVDPKIGCLSGITLLNIDQINRMLKFRRLKIQNFINDSEKLVEEFSDHQIKIFRTKKELKLAHCEALA